MKNKKNCKQRPVTKRTLGWSGEASGACLWRIWERGSSTYTDWGWVWVSVVGNPPRTQRKGGVFLRRKRRRQWPLPSVYGSAWRWRSPVFTLFLFLLVKTSVANLFGVAMLTYIVPFLYTSSVLNLLPKLQPTHPTVVFSSSTHHVDSALKLQHWSTQPKLYNLQLSSSFHSIP